MTALRHQSRSRRAGGEASGRLAVFACNHPLHQREHLGKFVDHADDASLHDQFDRPLQSIAVQIGTTSAVVNVGNAIVQGNGSNIVDPDYRRRCRLDQPRDWRNYPHDAYPQLNLLVVRYNRGISRVLIHSLANSKNGPNAERKTSLNSFQLVSRHRQDGFMRPDPAGRETVDPWTVVTPSCETPNVGPAPHVRTSHGAIAGTCEPTLTSARDHACPWYGSFQFP